MSMRPHLPRLASILDALPLILGVAMLGLAMWCIGAIYGFGSILNAH